MQEDITHSPLLGHDLHVVCSCRSLDLAFAESSPASPCLAMCIPDVGLLNTQTFCSATLLVFCGMALH